MSSAPNPVPQQRALTHAESADLAREVIDRARQALRAGRAPPPRAPAARRARLRAAARAVSRVTSLPGFEPGCIGACLMLCAANIALHMHP
ncbi:hypothetical protein [Novosphingobium sp.]|uniref:hypothetical protein n=1 Tax=Novosphingobium sp. TaxID=1874826 RepID=UPI003B519263